MSIKKIEAFEAFFREMAKTTTPISKLEISWFSIKLTLLNGFSKKKTLKGRISLE
jgi:hypothetical protein